MSVAQLMYCPGTLAEGFVTYSPTCLKKVFKGKKVNHILPYQSPGMNGEDAEKFIENRKRISISGVQEKLSLIQDKNQLRLTREGEQGTHILKPIPRDLKNVNQVPTNEHLTMQIAQQVYGISTAGNALIFFRNREIAYITQRFDVKDDGTKRGKEDFATLAGKTAENAGPDFKYGYSYQQAAELIGKYVAAFAIEIEKFFVLIVFNYLFSNGDAHLKNFSLLESVNGDYLLSPAYDLINTRLHVDDSAMALQDGLFSDDYETESFRHNGFYAYDDFYEFALKIGLKETRTRKLLDAYRASQQKVEVLTGRSFLNTEAKNLYLRGYRERLKALNYSFSERV